MKKLWKKSLISFGIILPITINTIAITSCGKKDNPPSKTTFADFTKAAEAESAVNIVAQTKPKGWDALPKDDLTKGNPKVVAQTVVLSITSKSEEQTAVFTATYVTKTAYNVSTWICSQQPTPPQHSSFNDFKTAAEAESAVNIVAQTKPKGWDALPKDDLTKETPKVVAQTVVLSITSKSKEQTAVFIATYVKDTIYNISAWTCSQQPTPPTWDVFLADAQKESAKNIVTGSGMKLWKDTPASKLIPAKFSVNDKQKTISIVITNSVSNSRASFTITYNKVAYNMNQWKYNNDLTYKWMRNASFPTKTQIKNITKIDNTIYVGTDLIADYTHGAGFYSSTDGKTFTQNKTLPADAYVTQTIKIDTIIYVATNKGLYSSTDGKTFSQNKLIPPDAHINIITKINTTIYLASTKGFYSSTDSGKTFTKNSALPSDEEVTQIVQKSKTIYLGTDVINNYGVGGGLYISTDDGKTFAENPVIPKDAYVHQIIQINKTTYIGLAKGLYSSTDNGKTFSQNKTIPSAECVVNQITKIDNSIYVSTTIGLYTSTNDGKTFTKNTSIKSDVRINEIVKIDNTIYLGTDLFGFYSSTDGKTFTKNTVIPADAIITQIIKIDNTIYVGTGCGELNCTADGLYSSTDGGKTFAQHATELTGIIIIKIMKINNTTYVVTRDSGLWSVDDH